MDLADGLVDHLLGTAAQHLDLIVLEPRRCPRVDGRGAVGVHHVQPQVAAFGCLDRPVQRCVVVDDVDTDDDGAMAVSGHGGLLALRRHS